LLHPADGRVFFVIPWINKTLVGTTDTLCNEPLENLQVTSEEIAYLLAGHNHYFEPALQAGDILSTFAGVRPLIRARANEPSAISREFQIFSSPSGLVSVAGGKYTTYRAMAESITNNIAARLGRRRRGRTRNFPLDGTPRDVWTHFEASQVLTLCSRHKLEDAAATHLVHRYGQHAADVAAYLQADARLANPIVQGEPDIQAEFAYQRDHEMAIYPADHLLRRTRLGLFRPDLLEQAKRQRS